MGGALGSHASSGSKGLRTSRRELAEQLRKSLNPRSSSALVLIAQDADVTDMLTAVGESAESVIRQSLSPTSRQRQLEASLSSGAQRAAAVLGRS